MKKVSLYFCLCISLVIVASPLVFGQTVGELQQQINTHNQTIQQLQDEIKQYEDALNKTSAQAKDLQSAVQTLDLNAKKLGADLNLTQNKISTTDLTIEQLGQEITSEQKDIDLNKQALADAVQSIHESDSNSMLETLLIYPNLSTFWGQVDMLNQFQSKVENRVTALKTVQTELLQNKKLTQAKKDELLNLKSQLADQKTVVDVNKQEKTKLLTQTKETESGFKSLIADRKAKEKAFEDELNKIQAQLKLKIDPNSLPTPAAGILTWPLASHRITQFFGNTTFAQAHAALYSGSGHNGIDIAASIGTPVMAALGGTILGTGDTDTVCPGASFGKWVMIEHPNGLSTLYAHLSVIKATQGQQVAGGDIVGYSGMTGYATGPHLHFTVYASQGVRIMSRQSKSCGGTYTMPIADLQAYLNPLNYLSADYTSI
jgi:murein DD-endopeptidase MepM/ murein hydrolase activator NlpD